MKDENIKPFAADGEQFRINLKANQHIINAAANKVNKAPVPAIPTPAW